MTFAYRVRDPLGNVLDGTIQAVSVDDHRRRFDVTGLVFAQVGDVVVDGHRRPLVSASQQAHAAIDIETNPSRRDHSPFGGISGSYSTDWKSIAKVPIRHAIGVLDNPWQTSDVAYLLTNGIVHAVDKLFRGDDPGGGGAGPGLGHLPPFTLGAPDERREELRGGRAGRRPGDRAGAGLRGRLARPPLR